MITAGLSIHQTCQYHAAVSQKVDGIDVIDATSTKVDVVRS